MFGDDFDTNLSPFVEMSVTALVIITYHNGCSWKLCEHVRLRLFCPMLGRGEGLPNVPKACLSALGPACLACPRACLGGLQACLAGRKVCLGGLQVCLDGLGTAWMACLGGLRGLSARQGGLVWAG